MFFFPPYSLSPIAKNDGSQLHKGGNLLDQLIFPSPCCHE